MSMSRYANSKLEVGILFPAYYEKKSMRRFRNMCVLPNDLIEKKIKASQLIKVHSLKILSLRACMYKDDISCLPKNLRDLIAKKTTMCAAFEYKMSKHSM